MQQAHVIHRQRPGLPMVTLARSAVPLHTATCDCQSCTISLHMHRRATCLDGVFGVRLCRKAVVIPAEVRDLQGHVTHMIG